jgi:ArsR family transcriptional regulator, virulence genes transcriptional regulator
MDEVYRLQAEVLKTLSNPKRLEIVHLLADGPREVSRLADELGISQPNVSQHLALMRAAGVVDAERYGREVRYRLSDPEIIVACETMRGVLIRRLSRISAVATRTPAEVLAGRAAASPGQGPADSPPSARLATDNRID